MRPLVGPADHDHLVPERRPEGRLPARRLRRVAADGRRGLCRHDHRAAGRHPPDRADAAADLRRVRRLAVGARPGACSRPAGRRHQGGAVGATSCARSGRSTCSWSGLSGTTTTMRKPIGPIRENPQTRAFLLDLMSEVVAVGRAHGVDLPRTTPSSVCSLPTMCAYDMTSSMHHDLRARQPARGALARRRRRGARPGRRACRRR